MAAGLLDDGRRLPKFFFIKQRSDESADRVSRWKVTVRVHAPENT